MDYEKKYKDALERMKSWVKGEHPECFCEAQKAAKFIFPELAESKDEKIKREIIAYINDFADVRDEKIPTKWLNWLEKQGEPTRTNIEIPFGANDNELQEVSYDIPEGFYAEIKDNRVVIRKVETKFKVGDWV